MALLAVAAAGCSDFLPLDHCDAAVAAARPLNTRDLGNRTSLTTWDMLSLHPARVTAGSGWYDVASRVAVSQGEADVAHGRISPPGAADVLEVYRVRPSGAPALDVFYGFTGGGDCEGRHRELRGDVRLLAAEVGEAARPGQGVHVWYAGFWENGTMFGTNLPGLDGMEWPKAGWYAQNAGNPLAVYVYGQDRSERPPHWGPAAALVPRSGTPVDEPAANVVGTGDAVAGLGYYTTIKGFNEALKDLPTTTTRVVRVPAADAYTQPGREQHPLYGASLVFLIQVEDVVDLPCPGAVRPLPTGAADPCTTP